MDSKMILSKKMNVILEKMECSKTRFIELCRHVDPQISKPTILNLINGRGKMLPSVETLSVVVKACHIYGNDELKRLTYDYLLSDEVNELTPENLSSYAEFGLSSDTLKFFREEETFGLYERDTLRGVNEFVPNVRRYFFTYVSIANNLVEVLKNIKELRNEKDIKEKEKIVNVILGYLNRTYLSMFLRQNKMLNTQIKKITSLKDVNQISNILFEIEGTLDHIYSSSKYFLINSINEYYLEKEGTLYYYEDEPLSEEEMKKVELIIKEHKKKVELDRVKSNKRRENKKKKTK